MHLRFENKLWELCWVILLKKVPATKLLIPFEIYCNIFIFLLLLFWWAVIDLKPNLKRSTSIWIILWQLKNWKLRENGNKVTTGSWLESLKTNNSKLNWFCQVVLNANWTRYLIVKFYGLFGRFCPLLN
jgi:hypothetical protein